jgi:pyruvate kinase
MPGKAPNIAKLIKALLAIHTEILRRETAGEGIIAQVDPLYRESARNFIRYLALRTFNLKDLQEQLSCLGLSSIGHSERYTLANIENILFYLHLMQGDAFSPRYLPGQHPINYFASQQLLDTHTDRLLGKSTQHNKTRIMVTLPREAADDEDLIPNLIGVGMDIARINCSHDDHKVWAKMIARVKKATADKPESCLIYMDLSGPKIRTGEVAIPSKKKKDKKPLDALTLHTGDTLRLYRNNRPAALATLNKHGQVKKPARIGITLPQAIENAREGDRIWFDDGAIGGLITATYKKYLEVHIIRTRPEGSRLKGEKGINLPDTHLDLPSLTEEDEQNLPFIARHADIVGYSFVRTPEDVATLQAKLVELDRQDIGLVLKIENNDAFNNLPALLLAAMKSPGIGVMIARGDLAVELGAERISEVQEQLMWLCEAAHIPIIWATQVLESLAKTGVATRAEISDASMSGRAECVMLNKGPFILETVQVLKNILARMDAHQQKKSDTLRSLNVAKQFFGG